MKLDCGPAEPTVMRAMKQNLAAQLLVVAQRLGVEWVTRTLARVLATGPAGLSGAGPRPGPTRPVSGKPGALSLASGWPGPRVRAAEPDRGEPSDALPRQVCRSVKTCLFGHRSDWVWARRMKPGRRNGCSGPWSRLSKSERRRAGSVAGTSNLCRQLSQ